jgi:glycosyltransferase involved in cell wall biosynthesis
MRSITDQTFQEFEMIVVFDGQPDSAIGRLIETYKDPRIRYIIKVHQGVSAARNTGMSMAQGEQILFVDCDDTLPSSALQRYSDALQEKHGANVIMGSYKSMGDNRVISSFEAFDSLSTIELLNAFLIPENGLGQVWGKSFRREFLERYRISFNVDLKYGEDAEFIFKLFSHSSGIITISSITYNYYFNKNSVVRKYNPNMSLEYQRTFLQMNNDCEGSLCETDRNLLKHNWNQFITYHLITVIINSVFHPRSRMSYRQACSKCLDLIQSEYYGAPLYECDYYQFSLSRRIMVYCLRHRLYRITWLMAQIRYLELEREK